MFPCSIEGLCSFRWARHDEKNAPAYFIEEGPHLFRSKYRSKYLLSKYYTYTVHSISNGGMSSLFLLLSPMALTRRFETPLFPAENPANAFVNFPSEHFRMNDWNGCRKYTYVHTAQGGVRAAFDVRGSVSICFC